MVKYKKIWSIICLFVLLATSGFGCKGLSTTQAALVKPVKLTYWTVFDDVGVLRQFANEYHTMRPYVTIDIRQVRYEEFDKLFVNALADDVAPDIISVHTRNLRKYISRLQPMPESVKVAKITVEGSYSKQVVVTTESNTMPSVTDLEKKYIGTVKDDVMVSGKIYGLPLSLDTLAIYYNKELLDKAGIAVPPATWDEFKEAVKKITKFNKDGKIVQSAVALGGSANIDNAPDILALLLMQNGVAMTDGGRVAFVDGLDRVATGHPSIEALRFYDSFARPTKDLYSWNESMGNALEEFARGRTAFYFGFAYDRPRILARGPQLPYDVIPVPQLGETKNVANYWIEGVTKKTKRPDEAWDFIRYMGWSENVKKYTDATHTPSPIRAQIEEQKKDPILAPFASQVLTAKNWYRGQDIDAASAALRSVIKQTIEPLPNNEDELKRDAEALIFGASVMQQTM